MVADGGMADVYAEWKIKEGSQFKIVGRNLSNQFAIDPELHLQTAY